MKNPSRLALAVLLSLASLTTVEAQELAPGMWTGALTAPGAEFSFAVTYEVSGSGNGLAIRMSSAMIPEAISFNDVRIDGESLTFWFEPGVRVNCMLTRDADGGYAGPCTDGSDRGEGAMVMVPPGALPR